MASNNKFADDKIAPWLESFPTASAEMDIAAVRQAGAASALSMPAEPHIAVVEDLEVAGLPSRLYRPSDELLPLIVYLHGGGWTIGSVASYDRVCRRLADRSGAAVVSVGYRLAPEHPWPASVDDAVATLKWVAEGHSALGAASRVAVAGDSAGGTLATLACLRLRDMDANALPALQVLLYPNTDLADDRPSMREKASGYGLTSDGIRFFNRQWVTDEEMWSDPRVSPLRADDLKGLPPALIVTAEHDPLRDQGEAYAVRLKEAGVDVRHRREDGLVHSFMRMDQVSPACARAGDRVADDIRELLQS